MLALSKLCRLPLKAAQCVRFAFSSPNRAPTRSTGAPMDQMGMVDAEGGRVVHRPRRAGGRLAMVVAVQNVLVVVCVLVTVYVYWDAQSKTSSEGIVHIQFATITVPLGSSTLLFSYTDSRNSIDFGEDTDKFTIRCTGPYILHMDICYTSYKKDEKMRSQTPWNLQLQVEGSKTPAGTVELQPSDEVCRGLHSIVFLRAKEVASLHLLNSTTFFNIKNVTVGLSSLLGNRCDTD
ncbi:uncharacterized protein LOC127533643 [Acanthochromis polyacanthus]|uniref:uncharacterized protein LOC127533643 n=1 Tax=Acanthochromis polyacanthus TaxID=80966 RepID=UPI0022344F38|nr:uncharacterized protein LOC127533643 [Acanthochromis polyacanthus]